MSSAKLNGCAADDPHVRRRGIDALRAFRQSELLDQLLSQSGRHPGGTMMKLPACVPVALWLAASSILVSGAC